MVAELLAIIFNFGFIISALIGITIFLFVFWIVMIVDAAQRKFKNDNEKVVWILLLVLLGWLGAIIYYFVIKQPDKH